MASNGEWGDAATEKESQDRYERFIMLDPVPEAGENKMFDRLCKRKALEPADFAAIGARIGTWNSREAIVYYFPDGLKYRVLEDDQRASEIGVRWVRAKTIPAQAKPVKGCIVAEGETDGAQLHRIAPDYDVLILPAGAKNITDTIITQCKQYDCILIALDDDEAGHEGARMLMERLPGATRILSGHNDWCEYAKANGRDPIDPLAFAVSGTRITFSLGDVLAADLGTYEDNHWYAEPILPVNGLAVIHAAKKSGKSFLQLEWLRSLATGTTFAGGYEPTQPPARVLLFQFEVLPYDFQQRAMMAFMATPEEHREALAANLFTYHLGDGTIPRMRVNEGLLDTVRAAAYEAEAQVLAFDPIQRMTGGADQAKSNEMDPLLDAFATLQQEGFTVIFSHHNNKASGKASRDANAMTGTQRFSGDPDSLVSVWHDSSCMVPDTNTDLIKQRNFTFELRNGAARGRSFTLRPDPDNPERVKVTYDELINPDNLNVGDDEVTPEF